MKGNSVRGEQQQQHIPISHPLFNMHAFKRKAPVLALFLVFEGPGGVGLGEGECVPTFKPYFIGIFNKRHLGSPFSSFLFPL